MVRTAGQGVGLSVERPGPVQLHIFRAKCQEAMIGIGFVLEFKPVLTKNGLVAVDGYIALTQAAELSEGLLPVALKVEHRLVCRQMHLNKECLGKTCLLHPLKGRSV